jgi:hypothetical protein
MFRKIKLLRYTKAVKLDITFKPEAQPLKANAYRTPEIRKGINKNAALAHVFCVLMQGGNFHLVILWLTIGN